VDGVRSGDVEERLADVAEEGEDGGDANKTAEEHDVVYVA